jgi:hypothetical protein
MEATMGADASDSLFRYLAAVMPEGRRLVDAAFGQGTWQQLGGRWDAVFLRRRGTRGADLTILAPKLASRWKVHDPQERKRLRQRAERNGHTVPEEKIALARTCLKWAEAELDRLQSFRLGESAGIAVERRDEWSVDNNGDLFIRRTFPHLESKTVVLKRGGWAQDEEGRVVNARPGELPSSMRLAWYVQAAKGLGELILQGDGPDHEVLGIAADKLLGESISFQDLLSPNTRDDGGAERSAGDPPLENASVQGPLDAIIAAEEADEGIASLLAQATPRQKEIVTGLLAKLEEGCTEAEAREAVAADLGITPSTLRVHLNHLTSGR